MSMEGKSVKKYPAYNWTNPIPSRDGEQVDPYLQDPMTLMQPIEILTSL